MELLGFIGILLGIVTIILLSVKGVHIAIASPTAALIVIIFNGMNIQTSILGVTDSSFMGSLGSYVIKFFLIFLLGSVLAKFMEASGATTSIAEFILERFGSDSPFRVLVAVFVVSAVLTYGGISLFVVMFAIIPLARTLFKKLNIAWNLIQIPLWLGIATFTMTILPGTPAIQNVIPIQFLGTSLVAATIPSLLGAVGCVAFGLWYMRHSLKKSLKLGETYATYVVNTEDAETERDLPPFSVSLVPLIVLVVIALSGSIFGNTFWKENIIYVALVIGILLAVLLFRKFIESSLKVLNNGATGSLAPIINTSAAVAFGAVCVTAPGFGIIQKALLGIPGSPLISLSLLTGAITAITGSSSGALGIVMPHFAQHYLATGLNPQMIHRVAAIASNVTTLVPQCGAYLTFLSLTDLNAKDGFKHSFITVAASSLIALVIVIGVGSILLPSH